MSYIVGLTGGIGCGKSLIANMFADLGVKIIDADLISREICRPNSPNLLAIKQYFGGEIINQDGSLNRKLLRQIIFSDSHKKQWLNNYLHPLIRNEMEWQKQQLQKNQYAIWVVPLLFENNLQLKCQRSLVIDCSKQTQIKRTLQRDNVSLAQVKSIINSQISREKRLELADDIIENEADLNPDITVKIKQQVSKLDKFYRQQAQGI